MSAVQEARQALKLRTAPPNQMQKRLVAFDRAIKNIPLNEYGLPKFLYRADLVPPGLLEMTAKEQFEALNVASIGISWREGFPTFENGIPLWGHMELEMGEDYALFEAYLGLVKLTGVRKLVDLQAEPRFQNIHIESMQSLFVFNYWAIRAKAYDLFIAAAHSKLREQRIMSAEDSQYLMAVRLLDRIETNVDGIFSKDKLDAMEPDKATKMLEALYKIKATALSQGGTQGNNRKGNADAPPPNATLEVTLRSVAKQAGASSEEEIKSSSTNSTIEMLRNNPDTAALAQELIIKLTYNNKQAEAPEGSKEGAHKPIDTITNPEDDTTGMEIDDVDRALLGLT